MTSRLRRRTPRPLVAATLVAVALVGPACSGSDLVESAPGDDVTTTSGSGLGIDNSPLAGLRSARAGGLTPDELADRVRAADPEVRDPAGAAAAYDAVVLAALAAEDARSDAPGPIAVALPDVSRKGEACTTFTRCRRLSEELTDIDYEGQSGGIQFLDNGDPGEATFEIIEVQPSGARTVTDRTSVQATALVTTPPVPDRQHGPPADGVLRIGTLLPVTGPRPDVARAALAGARLAVEDLNGDRGVLGAPVELVPDESGDGSPEATKAAVARLIARGVDVVVGGTTFDIDSVAIGPLVDAGIVMISPSDAFRGLSVVPDRGLFFRLAPPEELEGKVLGRLVADDGFTRVAIVSPSSGPELDLANDVNAAVNATGGDAVALVVVDPGTDMAAAVTQIVDSGAQAVAVVIPTATAGDLLRELVARGKGPGSLPTYAAAATVDDELIALVGDA